MSYQLLPIALALLSCCSAAIADDVQDLLDNVKSERSKLHTAQFRIHTNIKITSSLNTGETIRERVEKWEGECVYDGDTGNHLMKYTLSSNIFESPSTPVNCFCITHVDDDGFKVYDSSLSSPKLIIYKAQKSSSRSHQEFAPINPLCVGLCTVSSLKAGESLTQVLSNILITKKRLKPPATSEDAVGNVVLTEFYDDGLRRQITFGRNRSWTPVTYKVEYGTLDQTTNSFTPSKLFLESKIEWTEFSGQWVPARIDEKNFRHNQSDFDNSNREVTETSVDFEWESVNEAIDPTTFDYKLFGLPPRTMIVDCRGAPPVVLGKIEDNL